MTEYQLEQQCLEWFVENGSLMQQYDKFFEKL